mgnify:CR=1 FL=1
MEVTVFNLTFFPLNSCYFKGMKFGLRNMKMKRLLRKTSLRETKQKFHHLQTKVSYLVSLISSSRV